MASRNIPATLRHHQLGVVQEKFPGGNRVGVGFAKSGMALLYSPQRFGLLCPPLLQQSASFLFRNIEMGLFRQPP
jgi:hypothetical protein